MINLKFKKKNNQQYKRKTKYKNIHGMCINIFYNYIYKFIDLYIHLNKIKTNGIILICFCNNIFFFLEISVMQ